jgi:hypothetical protein
MAGYERIATFSHEKGKSKGADHAVGRLRFFFETMMRLTWPMFGEAFAVEIEHLDPA